MAVLKSVIEEANKAWRSAVKKESKVEATLVKAKQKTEEMETR